jgi:hypothetical protein
MFAFVKKNLPLPRNAPESSHTTRERGAQVISSLCICESLFYQS